VTTKSDDNVSETKGDAVTPSPSSDANARREWAELIGDPPPVEEPWLIEALRNNLAFTACLAVDALVELVRDYHEQRDRGQSYRPNTQIADEWADALGSLDKCQFNFCRQTQRQGDAWRVISNALENYGGAHLATIVENALDKYRRITNPGYAIGQDYRRGAR
jgi:hypothetical protein